MLIQVYFLSPTQRNHRRLISSVGFWSVPMMIDVCYLLLNVFVCLSDLCNRQKDYALQVWLNQALNSWPLDHTQMYHGLESFVITTKPSGISIKRRELVNYPRDLGWTWTRSQIDWFLVSDLFFKSAKATTHQVQINLGLSQWTEHSMPLRCWQSRYSPFT